jgi:hypothetical protein
VIHPVILFVWGGQFRAKQIQRNHDPALITVRAADPDGQSHRGLRAHAIIVEAPPPHEWERQKFGQWVFELGQRLVDPDKGAVTVL